MQKAEESGWEARNHSSFVLRLQAGTSQLGFTIWLNDRTACATDNGQMLRRDQQRVSDWTQLVCRTWWVLDREEVMRDVLIDTANKLKNYSQTKFWIFQVGIWSSRVTSGLEGISLGFPDLGTTIWNSWIEFLYNSIRLTCMVKQIVEFESINYFRRCY